MNYSKKFYCNSKKAAFTKPSRATNGVRDELLTTETLSFRCKSERWRLMRGAENGRKKSAFTLAEVLITIGIIGIVAAMVLPTIINETRDKEYSAARKRMMQTLGEAGKMMSVNGIIRNATNAEDFVENLLSKQLKIIKTCSNDNLKDCGIMTDTNKIFNISESPITMPTSISQLAYAPSMNGIDKRSYGFVMANGYSVNLFYNPNCVTNNKESDHYGQNSVCINAIYDVNGLALPNQVGKDIGFVTVLYPDIQSVTVAPDVAKSNAASSNFNNAAQACINYSKEYNSVPNRDELLAMYYNGNLLGITSGYYWSASSAGDGLGWRQSFNNGYRYRLGVSNVDYVRCVRR